MTHHQLRAIALGLLLLLVTLGALTARAVFEGQEAMLRSDQAFNRGDVREAAGHARRAAVLYAPGAPHVVMAYARLRAIAIGSEAAGDAPTARLAWRAVRGAVLETRHGWIPFPDLLREANQQLARLDTLELPPTADRESARRHSLGLLTEVDAPRAPFVFLLVLGLVLTALGLLFMTFRGLNVQGVFQTRNVRVAGCIILVGALCWTVAAYHA